MLLGSQSWVKTQKNETKVETATMRFQNRVKGCTRTDRIRNTDIKEELNILNINEEYKDNWTQMIE